MSAMLIIEQITDTAELPTVASGDYILSAIADGLVMKNDSQSILYLEAWRRATAQTTDATPSVVTSSIVIAEGQVALVKAKALGRRSDLSAALGVEMWVIVRRASAGNVTIVGSQQPAAAQEDSASTPAFDLVANTGTQKIDAQVTGAAAQTWNFQVDITELVY